MVEAIISEIELRHKFLPDPKVDTIYFGGGTPSILKPIHIELIFKRLSDFFEWDERCEITFEANPEDLSLDMCRALKNLGVNRLSIGIQSFSDVDLTALNRAHDAELAHSAVQNSKTAGFENLNVDLMFALMFSSDQTWVSNLRTVADYEVSHISCYNLTIEEQTVFQHKIRKGDLNCLPDSVQEDQFLAASDFLRSIGYQHYEISNYALPGFESKHNLAYWNRHSYLGLGPSAHSFANGLRAWNPSNNHRYLKNMEIRNPDVQFEVLTEEDEFNELIMLGLRRSQGIKRKEVDRFSQRLKDHFNSEMEKWLTKSEVVERDGYLILKREKLYLSDYVASELFIEKVKK